MDITNEDKHYYYHALENLTERFEIANQFAKNNGLSAFPAEELTELMIRGLKEWFDGPQGEAWLYTLGYSRSSIVASGFVSVSLSGSLCPVCSGMFSDLHGNYCEKCGRFTCEPCVSIVDPIYGVCWCNNCLDEQPLTNLLIYNE